MENKNMNAIKTYLTMFLIAGTCLLSGKLSQAEGALNRTKVSITALEPGENSVSLTVSPKEGAALYQYQIAADERFETLLESKKSAEAGLTFTGLAPEESYYLRVRASFIGESGRKSFGDWEIAMVRTSGGSGASLRGKSAADATAGEAKNAEDPGTSQDPVALPKSSVLYRDLLNAYESWLKDESSGRSSNWNSSLYGKVPLRDQIKDPVLRFDDADFNHDNVPDLIVSISSGSFFFEQIYTHNGTRPVCLFPSGFWTSCGGPGYLIQIGENGVIRIQHRENADIYSDFYRIRADRSGIQLIAAVSEVHGKDRVHYYSSTVGIGARKLLGRAEFESRYEDADAIMKQYS